MNPQQLRIVLDAIRASEQRIRADLSASLALTVNQKIQETLKENTKDAGLRSASDPTTDPTPVVTRTRLRMPLTTTDSTNAVDTANTEGTEE